MASRTRPTGPTVRRSLWQSGVGAGLALVAVVGGAPAGAQISGENSAAAKGAQTYCFMRNNGNNHEVSWTAAYALIKRQSASLFKTSPEHAAVMITEAVVQNPGNYPDCGRYLGDLYSRRVRMVANPPSSGDPTAIPTDAPGGSPGATGGMTRSERYGN
ncbi:penicillin amidase [Cyanobium sp. FGCU-52]|nr:penicillin amidase [Cyanobium sp. FGCU52]